MSNEARGCGGHESSSVRNTATSLRTASYLLYILVCVFSRDSSCSVDEW